MTIRRGGLLTDERHRDLALWAASCAEHVLGIFEKYVADDDRPRMAIIKTREWASQGIRTTESKVAAYHANLSGKGTSLPARYAAYSAGQAAVVAHVPEHALGAAAYAIRAVFEENKSGRMIERARDEWHWQKSILPDDIRELVIEDSSRRDDLCWKVFSL